MLPSFSLRCSEVRSWIVSQKMSAIHENWCSGCRICRVISKYFRKSMKTETLTRKKKLHIWMCMLVYVIYINVYITLFWMYQHMDLVHTCKIQLIFMPCFPTSVLLWYTDQLSKLLTGVNVCRLQREGVKGVKGGSKGRKGREWCSDTMMRMRLGIGKVKRSELTDLVTKAGSVSPEVRREAVDGCRVRNCLWDGQ